MRYLTVFIRDGDDLLLDFEEFAVFGLIRQFGFPDLTRRDRLPQLRVEGLVVLAGFENPWASANRFSGRIASQRFEGGIDVLDRSLWIGDKYRFVSLFGLLSEQREILLVLLFTALVNR
jgi:hypothetical protein